ncbi:peptidoglycan-binding protein [Candidatus Parcubacteria bacterium]|nr:peptidoglycan-binding protein [Candidatus Parcubacteria bacterium]
MLSLLGKWAASIALSATAFLGLTVPSPADVPTEDPGPSTAEELSTSLHYKITDLRAGLERDKLEILVPLPKPMTLGVSGDSVKRLQELLANIEFLDQESVSGYYGPTTQGAVSVFQEGFQLKVTGVVDRETLESIFTIVINRMRLGDTYFPEESRLLGLATTSEALLMEDSDTTNTSGEDSSLSQPASDSNSSDDSTAQTVAEPVTPALVVTAPATPSAPTLTVRSSIEIDLSWKAVSGAVTYNIYRSTTNTRPATPTYSGISATTKNDTGLKPNTSYHYWLTAVNTGGESSVSPQANASTKSH